MKRHGGGVGGGWRIRPQAGDAAPPKAGQSQDATIALMKMIEKKLAERPAPLLPNAADPKLLGTFRR